MLSMSSRSSRGGSSISAFQQMWMYALSFGVLVFIAQGNITNINLHVLNLINLSIGFGNPKSVPKILRLAFIAGQTKHKECPKAV